MAQLRLSILLLIGILASLSTIEAQCRPLPPAKTEIDFVVTAIDRLVEDGIVRIEGTLSGKPHTAQRIDSIVLLDDGRAIEATDIDGIDFKRYFQWEDDGEIHLEIDFPAIDGRLPKPTVGSSLTFKTVNGDINIKIKQDTKK